MVLESETTWRTFRIAVYRYAAMLNYPDRLRKGL